MQSSAARAGYYQRQHQVWRQQLPWGRLLFPPSAAQQARDPFAQALRDPITGRFSQTRSIASRRQPRWADHSNKAFFFVYYQGLRQRLGNSFLLSVPTNTVRNTCLAAAAQPATSAQYITSGSVYNYPVSGGSPVAYRAKRRSRAALSPQASVSSDNCPSPNTNSSLTQNNYAASGNVGQRRSGRRPLDYPVNDKLRPSAVMIMPSIAPGSPCLRAIAVRAFGITNTTELRTFRTKVPPWVPTTS